MHKIKTLALLYILLCLVACSSRAGQPVTPGITALAPPSITTVPQSTEAPTEPGTDSFKEIPQYGLAGKLVLILYHTNGNTLIELNLQTGKITTLFQAPENSWLSEAQVSPDNQQILLTYAPPAPSAETQFGYSDLYLMPYDRSSPPQPFLSPSNPKESYFFTAWAPDGQTIYFTHLYLIDPTSDVPAYQNDIEKVTLGGEISKVADDALWPVVSPDGTNVSFLYADPVTFGNDLYLAKPDGTEQTPVLPPGVYPPVDSHIYTIDGKQLIFSMVNPQTAPASSWLERLFGVKIVSAHSVPSDWYSAPLSGGVPQRLTNMEDMNLNGDLSPDGSQMAFISATGLYVMNVDGTNITQLSDAIIIGTVCWIP